MNRVVCDGHDRRGLSRMRAAASTKYIGPGESDADKADRLVSRTVLRVVAVTTEAYLSNAGLEPVMVTVLQFSQ